MLRLEFLGTLKAETDGKDITREISGKSMALLAILMTQNGRASRKELIGYLWPESEENAARYNLRFNLWQLRKQIPPDASGQPFLMVTRDACSVNRAYPYICDIKEVLEADISGETRIDRLEQIGKLFKGEFFENRYFSDCESFEELIILQRYVVEHKKQTLLKKLIAAYSAQGNEEKCMQALAACEELDPYDEKNAVVRMSLLLKSGRYQEALDFYQRFYQRLALDIGVTPSKELMELAGSIAGQKQKEGKTICIEADTLPSVDCFYLAGLLEQLIETPGFSAERYLDKKQIGDLAFIQRKLGDCPWPQGVPMVRVVNSFLALITGMVADGTQMEIRFSSWMDLDSVSKDTILLLKNKLKGELVITEWSKCNLDTTDSAAK